MANKTRTSFAYIPHCCIPLLYFRTGILIILFETLVKAYKIKSVYVNNYCSQFSAMATSKCDLDLVLQILSHVLPTLIYTIEYGAYYFNAEKVSYIFSSVFCA
jgi:hypothetical protein